MNVVIASHWYPISISRYYEKALRNMSGINVTTVGPTSGASIPWGSEFHYPEHAFTPDFPTTADPLVSGAEVTALIEMRKIKDIDLWITVDAGYYPDAEMPWPHAIIGTDPHCLNYDRQRDIADQFFSMQKVYTVPGDYVLPYCYSEYDHYPEEQPKQWDVTVLGLQYWNRIATAESLKAANIDVECKLGYIWDDYRATMCSAPICFTWSSKQDLIARVFEGLAMGRLVVTNRVPDLDRFFEEEEHLLAYSGQDEAIAHIEWALENPEVIKSIAQAGQKQVQGHTYTARIEELLDCLNIA